MEKIIRVLSVFVLLLGFQASQAQDVPQIRAGLIRTHLTITPSYMFSGGQSYFYLHGNLEGYLSSHLSVTGDSYYYLGNLSAGNGIFKFNHSIFCGFSWHFTKNSHDLYLGFEPGVALTQLNAAENDLATTHIGVNPLFSPFLGYNFYVYKIFHFFLQTRLVAGEHNYDLHKNLTEFRFSAGLGFNINAIKAK